MKEKSHAHVMMELSLTEKKGTWISLLWQYYAASSFPKDVQAPVWK
jgi:hypothetical protein